LIKLLKWPSFACSPTETLVEKRDEGSKKESDAEHIAIVIARTGMNIIYIDYLMYQTKYITLPKIK